MTGTPPPPSGTTSEHAHGARPSLAPDGRERRRFSRIPFRSASVCFEGGGAEHQTTLVDISLNGALIARPPSWTPVHGDSHELKVQLVGADFEIAMQATVVHITEDRVGLRCDQIDAESMSHIRRLVELNLGDAERAGSELSRLLEATQGAVLRPS